MSKSRGIKMEDQEKQIRLETYFDKYPDVPKEVIVKESLLRYGQWFTKPATDLTNGIEKSFTLFSYYLIFYLFKYFSINSELRSKKRDKSIKRINPHKKPIQIIMFSIWLIFLSVKLIFQQKGT